MTLEITVAKVLSHLQQMLVIILLLSLQEMLL